LKIIWILSMLKIRTDEILAVENANAKKRERERERET